MSLCQNLYTHAHFMTQTSHHMKTVIEKCEYIVSHRIANNFDILVICSCFCCRLLTFSKLTFSKKPSWNTCGMSNGLDLDQVRRFVGPDQGPNCLQRLSDVNNLQLQLTI